MSDRQKKLRTIVFPLLAALIWGAAFAFQRSSAGRVGALTFTAARSTVAALAMAAALLLRRKEPGGERRSPAAWRSLLTGGALCGALLALATNLQQQGLVDTAAGKAGFITALYIVLVPLLGLLLKRRVSGALWCSVAMAVAGLYLLCVRGGFALTAGDLLILACALVFAVHILTIDHYTRNNDPMELSCVQFVVVALLSWGAAFLIETPTWAQLWDCRWELLYVGVFSSAVAYTLQMAAQKAGEPVTVSLLLSMESVFSVLAGAALLGESLSPRELAGCAVMLCAVTLAQLPTGGRKRRSACVQGPDEPVCQGGGQQLHD